MAILVTATIVLDVWGEVRNDIAFVAGDTVSFDEVAVKVSIAGSATIGMELGDIAHLVSDLRAHPDDGMKKYRVVVAKGIAVAWDIETSWNAIRDIQMKTVEDFAKELCNRI